MVFVRLLFVASVMVIITPSRCCPDKYCKSLPLLIDLPLCECEKLNPCRYEQIIRPPQYLELPPGLGFPYYAVPEVAKAYGDPCSGCSECCPNIPISSPCSCSVLATPINPCFGCCAKPVIL